MKQYFHLSTWWIAVLCILLRVAGANPHIEYGTEAKSEIVPDYPAWTTEFREHVDFPPMQIEPATGPLRPRQVTEKDFYLSVVDVSNPHRMVVKFIEEAMIRWNDYGLYSKTGTSTAQVREFLNRHKNLLIRRECPKLPEDLFDYWEANGERNTGQDLANLNNFYVLEIPGNPDALKLIQEVIAIDIVETAFYMPRMELACSDIPPTTPSFVSYQSYLDTAPLGVHANYSGAYYPEGGRGNPYAWCIDIELDWTEGHEDFPTDFAVIGGDRNEPANHGDAVIGVIAACSNTYGVTGISCDVTPKGISSWVQGEDDLVPALNLAAANLFAGESYLIEHHAEGPDPGYPCDTDCGNCGQFRLIAMEYWDNNFNAIQTHTANGIIVYEAAGNGQMDLDNAVYGNRFQRWYRDSGAIIVGAAVPGTRAAECWSCYGSRLDCQGWGGSIASCGYNNTPGWNPGDILQAYTLYFGGTSGASPMVVGAGNCLQGVSQRKYGTTISPTQMRDYLSTTGTPWTGTRDVGERPNLVDAINYIEPDVRPDHRSDWTGPVVPRNQNDAIPGFCGISPLLDGNAATTYLNLGIANDGRSPAPDAGSSGVETRFYVDDYNPNWTETWAPNIPALSTSYAMNRGPITVRGGRHTTIWELNPESWFTEYDHTNNSTTNQFVWSPFQLTNDVGITRLSPPVKDWGSPVYLNGDGFRAAGTWWTAVGILPQSGNDIDLYCYADSYSSTSGFDIHQEVSARGSGSSDVILINGNISGYGTSRLFQAIRFSTSSTSNFAIEADGSINAWSTPFESSRSMDPNDVLDVFELYMVSGQQYFIGAVDLFGGFDLGIGLYLPGSEYQDFYDYVVWKDAEGADGTEYIVYTPPITGYYAAVVIKPGYSSYAIGGTYTFKFESPGTPDLIPAGRPGWVFPAVARNTPDGTPASCSWPAAIQGNTTNYINGTWYNDGTNSSSAAFTNEIRLDGNALASLVHSGSLGVFEFGEVNNHDVGTISGGRHTLTIELDRDNTVAESNEANNEFTWQYAWSPLALTRDAPVLRASPPEYGTWVYPNSKGFSFDPGGNSPSGVAILASSSSADYDLYLCSNYSGTGDGFTNYVGTSTYGAYYPDYVIVPTSYDSTFYPAVINYNGATDNFFIEAQNVFGRVYENDAWSSGLDTLTAGSIWNMYHFLLFSGTDYNITCQRISGSSNIALRLFSEDNGISGRGSAIAAVDDSTGGFGEVLTYTPISSGLYTLVVEKTDAAQTGLSIVYSVGTIGPPPENDTCPGTAVTSLPYSDTGSTESANYDMAHCIGGGAPDVFYTMNLPECQYVNASLCGSLYDTGLEVRTDGSCPGNVIVACNDDFCGLQSEVEFMANAAANYYIIIEGYDFDSGEFTLNITGTPCPLDAPAGLTIIRSGNDVILSWNSVAGANSYTVHRDVWPDFVPDGGNEIHSTPNTTYTDSGILSDPHEKQFYVVTASQN
ncbi:hypothetical protein KKC97_13390 [bacterium]|nr:hypothetical protein [bacterium]